MKCPVCITTDLNMTQRQGVEIDYCPQCRGVWLDRGELDKIIERSTVPQRREAETSYEHNERRDDRYDDDHQRSYPKKKRKSFFEDIFDF